MLSHPPQVTTKTPASPAQIAQNKPPLRPHRTEGGGGASSSLSGQLPAARTKTQCESQNCVGGEGIIRYPPPLPPSSPFRSKHRAIPSDSLPFETRVHAEVIARKARVWRSHPFGSQEGKRLGRPLRLRVDEHPAITEGRGARGIRSVERCTRDRQAP